MDKSRRPDLGDGEDLRSPFLNISESANNPDKRTTPIQNERDALSNVKTDSKDQFELVRDTECGTSDAIEMDRSNVSVTLEREHWTRGADFLLTVLGFSIGLENLWRFPYLCVRNGGGSFVIPFIICVVICGLPMIFLEVSLGQFTGQNNVNVYRNVCPLFKGIGFIMIIPTIICTLYQTILMAWILYFLGNSFLGSLPWDSCDRSWNTDKCFKPMDDNLTTAIGNATVDLNITNTSIYTSTEEFWRFHVLDLSSGLEDIGYIKGHLVLTLALSWLIVFVCVVKGVHSVGKVVYVTVFLPYILLTTFLIKGLTLEGSIDGILFYVNPDPSKLMDMRVWLEAAVHVFYSLGQGWGAVITMASFNNINRNCLRDSVIICFVSEGTSLFCGLVIFTILGFVAHELGVSVSEVIDSGPGLGFIVYPKALSKLPIPQLWSVLFFLMLTTFFLDGQFGMVESIITLLTDYSPRLRKRRTWIRLAGCLIGFVVGIPMCTQGGMYIFQLLDWYIAAIFVPVVCALECIIIAWIYGLERFNRDVQLMLGRGIPLFIRICLGVITPLLFIVIFVFMMRNYKPPSYKEYRYPVGGQVLGWIVAFLPLLPLPVSAGLELWKHRNKPIMKMLADSTSPSAKWIPNAKGHQATYKYELGLERDMTFMQRLKMNILGR